MVGFSGDIGAEYVFIYVTQRLQGAVLQEPGYLKDTYNDKLVSASCNVTRVLM